MDSFIFSVNAVLPIILMVALGYALKKAGFITKDFSKRTNKLVFRFFLPAMLFVNVYDIDIQQGIDLNYILYVVIFVLLTFFVMIPAVTFITKDKFRRGPLLQATFRSNFAFIGIPLAQALFGDEGVKIAALLSAVTIPLYNILAVISLSMFNSESGKFSVKKILTGIVKNPLIQGIFLGVAVLIIRILFVKLDFSFRLNQTPIYTVLDYLSKMATPLALITLGAQFEFSAVKELKKEILWGTILRTVIVPVVALSISLIFRNTFSGAHYASFIAVFATPVAISTVPMTQEMNNDAVLAGQLVVWTTIFSALTVFIASFIFKFLGIF